MDLLNGWILRPSFGLVIWALIKAGTQIVQYNNSSQHLSAWWLQWLFKICQHESDSYLLLTLLVLKGSLDSQPL